MGGSVALQLQKSKNGLDSRTYGAPVWDPFGSDSPALGFNGKVDRYRNLGHPFIVLNGSSNSSIKLNPFNFKSLTHDYSNLGTKVTSGNSENANGYQNGDGTITLTQ